MYKIVLIDDEEIVRQGIRDHIDWKSIGIQFVGEAEDGLQGYELVKEKKPDIIVVDICMPHMDGLEFTRLVKDGYPDCKVIILTGYDEFDYARQALRLGVEDYVLKPITRVELTELLNKVVKRLDSERKQQQEVETIKDQLYESLPLLKEKFLNKLITGDLEKRTCDEKSQILGIDTRNKSYVYTLAVMDIDNFSEAEVDFKQDEVELIRFGLLNMASEIISEQECGFAFITNEGRIALLFYASQTNEYGDEQHAFDQIQKVILEIKQAVVQHLKFTISVGIGCMYPDLCQVWKSYREARKALDYRFFMGDDCIVNIQNVKSEYGGKFKYPEELEKKLLSGLKASDYPEVQKALREIFELMRTSQVNIDTCRNTVIEIMVTMFKSIAEIGVKIDEIFDEQIDLLKQIYQFKNLNEIQQWVRTIYTKIAAYIEDRSSATKTQVLKVREYVERNYADKELSFKAICKVVHLSPSYLSNIFKKEAGETFIEYLTHVRLEKAKELLRNTSLRSYEVADRVGYGDPHYFSSIFKKNVNMSPSEYREKTGGRVQDV